ncbi:hypothetical protein ACFWDI_27225 [Streptomyces sp. NPDC060064]|uniref:hypothetical protein n=1 Tax=Streptomyces sp. NPDC060064 TaxID=3347049 RepID=UPI0036910CF6
MVRSVLTHHLHQRFSDAEIGQLVRHGSTAAFQTVVVRHWPAVVTCLHTCFLITARTPALREWNHAPAPWDMADEFRNWAAAGDIWPLSVQEFGAFAELSRTAPREAYRALEARADARTDITLGLMAHGPPGAEIAVRLDRPDAPAVATIPIPEAGSPRWVHAAVRPTVGVHTVYLTACCTTGNSCVSITGFTSG